MALQTEVYTFGVFAVHNYLVWDDETLEAVLIDAGKAPQPVIDFVAAKHLKLSHLFLTHGHIDHVEGQRTMLAAFPELQTYLNANDDFWLENLTQQADMFGLDHPETPRIDHKINHGDTFQFTHFHIEARHAPGHSPGGICYWIPEMNTVFVGDVIFAGSIGRTDFPRGDFETLMRAIDEQVLSLPDSATLYPGHGPASTVGKERRTNPFVLHHSKL